MKVVCIGCDRELTDVPVYAIMHEDTFMKLQITPHLLGPKMFHAGAICRSCHMGKGMKRKLKAHFSFAKDIDRMLMLAGSDEIGG